MFTDLLISAKKRTHKFGSEILNEMDIGSRSKLSVRKVMSLLAQGTDWRQPYGTNLLLDADRVIKTIEAFRSRDGRRFQGRTTLNYFISVIRVLKEMAFAKVAGATEAHETLKKYKDTHYQHFAIIKGHSSVRRQTSHLRKDLVERNMDAFERNLAKVQSFVMVGEEK